VRMMQALRELDLKKTPSISETLDWARALLVLNARDLDREIVEQTLNVILKYEGDVRKTEGQLDKLLAKAVAKPRGAVEPEVAPAAAEADKDALH
jgi:hypothetical protein